jgi:small ligand-binding sensory domain FIST
MVAVRWASALSEQPITAEAVAEAAAALRRELREEPDLVLVFASPHHATSYGIVPDLCGAAFPGALVVGCSGAGVVGGGREIEQKAALSITAAHLPGVALSPLRFEEAPATPEAFRRAVGLAPAEEPCFVVLPDPFSADAEAFVERLDEAYPGAPKVGGLASGGGRPGQNALFLGRERHRGGVVGVAFSGEVVLDTLVAQGCRPIGEPCIVTRSKGNVLFEMDRGRPIEILRELYTERLDARDRELFQSSLFIGLEMREQKGIYRQGDFLIRNLIGVDPDSGAIAIGAQLRQYQVVQFHLRDARTSAEDLKALLDDYRTGRDATPSGALMFSCVGRGAGLYGEPDHDTRLVHDRLGRVPLGGFFCNGEIGPVGGTTFLHGYTSSFGIFRPTG